MNRQRLHRRRVLLEAEDLLSAREGPDDASGIVADRDRPGAIRCYGHFVYVERVALKLVDQFAAFEIPNSENAERGADQQEAAIRRHGEGTEAGRGAGKAANDGSGFDVPDYDFVAKDNGRHLLAAGQQGEPG